MWVVTSFRHDRTRVTSFQNCLFLHLLMLTFIPMITENYTRIDVTIKINYSHAATAFDKCVTAYCHETTNVK